LATANDAAGIKLQLEYPGRVGIVRYMRVVVVRLLGTSSLAVAVMVMPVVVSVVSVVLGIVLGRLGSLGGLGGLGCLPVGCCRCTSLSRRLDLRITRTTQSRGIRASV
jgi:hypothetical protein